MNTCRTLLVLANLCLITLSFNLTFDQFIHSTPQTFGLLTVTHSRKGDNSYFFKSLDFYASMECPQMTEISIVWNNDIEPEAAGLPNKQKWKRPVYFYQAKQNSMDNRYNLPAESKAQVFFSMDDDVDTNCQELLKSFEIYKQNSIGDVGPLVTFDVRGYDLESQNQRFKYVDPKLGKYYSMGLIGISWVSRFYLQIYSSNSLWEIQKIREIVRKKNNCDDIALNYIINFFFPQFFIMEFQTKVVVNVFPGSQGKTSTHYKFRNDCMRQFTDIFGFNPLRLIHKQAQKNEERFVSLTAKYSVYMKRKEIYEKLVAGDRVQEAITKFQQQAKKGIVELSNKMAEQQKLAEQITFQKVNDQIEDLSKPGDHQEQQQDEGKKLEQVQIQLQKEERKVGEMEVMLLNNEQKIRNLQKIISESEAKNSLQTFKSLGLIAGVTLIGIIINLSVHCFASKRKEKLYNTQLGDNDQEPVAMPPSP